MSLGLLRVEKETLSRDYQKIRFIILWRFFLMRSFIHNKSLRFKKHKNQVGFPTSHRTFSGQFTKKRYILGSSLEGIGKFYIGRKM
jgi:hypothetical protein